MFLNENICISIKISLNFVRKGSINNIPALEWHDAIVYRRIDALLGPIKLIYAVLR